MTHKSGLVDALYEVMEQRREMAPLEHTLKEESERMGKMPYKEVRKLYVEAKRCGDDFLDAFFDVVLRYCGEDITRAFLSEDPNLIGNYKPGCVPTEFAIETLCRSKVVTHPWYTFLMEEWRSFPLENAVELLCIALKDLIFTDGEYQGVLDKIAVGDLTVTNLHDIHWQITQDTEDERTGERATILLEVVQSHYGEAAVRSFLSTCPKLLVCFDVTKLSKNLMVWALEQFSGEMTKPILSVVTELWRDVSNARSLITKALFEISLDDEEFRVPAQVLAEILQGAPFDELCPCEIAFINTNAELFTKEFALTALSRAVFSKKILLSAILPGHLAAIQTGLEYQDPKRRRVE